MSAIDIGAIEAAAKAATSGSIAWRFWSKVRFTPGCWLWTGSANKPGYGRFYANGTVVRAHAFALEFAGIEVPSGLFVCHHCDTPACVRPDHLFIGTHADNMADAIAKGRLKGPPAPQPKTHCPGGHPYSGENLYLTRAGVQQCRVCRKHRKRVNRPYLQRTFYRGESNFNSKLTTEHVRQIRRLAASGLSYRRIASQFGVSGFTVAAIVKRVTWDHVQDEAS